MRAPIRVKPLAAAACAAALVVSGAGAASAQGSLAGSGSSTVPVFDSPSTATLKAEGEGKYSATYTNRSGKDLACAGLVLPEDVAKDFYEELKTTDFLADGNNDEGPVEDEISEAQAAVEDAMEAGHFGIMVGDDGMSARDYVRALYIAQVEANGGDYTEEELEEYLDTTGMLDQANEIFGGKDFINFVDQGATATWSAQMAEKLPAGGNAGGIVMCFNGIAHDQVVTETTYVEIEHASEGPSSDQGNVSDEGIFGSIERIFGS